MAPPPEHERPEAGEIETPPHPEGAVPTLAEKMRLKRRPKLPPALAVDPVTVKIEKILEDGVGEAYSRLSPIAKQEFKLKGEDTARKIRILVRGTHIKVKKIFRLILEWLKLLPGVNRFFLEQEAKIKTDRIIELSKRK